MSKHILPPETTLADAKKWLHERVRNGGAPCPCCLQNVKTYRRTVNAMMARWLIELVMLYLRTGTWAHITDIAASISNVPRDKLSNSSSGDFSKLAYWRLIEAKPNSDDDSKKDSGYWRPTERGIQFAYNGVAVAKYAEIYDSRRLKLDNSELITIRDALGKWFHYAELMAALPTTAPTFR